MQIIFENVEGNDTVYMDCLRAICGNTKDKSMVDLCCNKAPHTPKLNFKWNTFIDILPRELDDKKWQDYFIKADVLEILKNESEIYDVSICSDGLEHFTEFDGLVLLMYMHLRSGRQVLFTPLGEYMVDKVSIDPEGHHSGWEPGILENLKPNHFAYISLPNYHPALGIGAFFFWHCENIKEDFERVENELKNKSWAKK